MSRIKIKNFGPIKGGYQQDDGWMDIKKVTVFIGNQGSGKSTVAKVIASMAWLEKALHRGDVIAMVANKLNYFEKLFGYLRLGNSYFNKDTQIIYQGSLYEIKYDPNDQAPMVKRLNSDHYAVPKIMYVPAERNFLASVKAAYDVKGLPPALFEFAEEFRRSQKELKGMGLPLPIKGYDYLYSEGSDTSYITGDDFMVDLLEASSGFQSLIPLFVVSANLANMIKSGKADPGGNLSVDQSIRMNQEVVAIMSDASLNAEEKVHRARSVQTKYQNAVFFNIVEEPEQNLFPTSQKDILWELLKYNNMLEGNKLVLTTHSPYLINYLTLAVKADMVKAKLLDNDSIKKLNNIVPLQSTIHGDDLVIYELDETGGTIKKLDDYKGLPSDENDLNKILAEGNELFGKLLDIEDLCQ